MDAAIDAAWHVAMIERKIEGRSPTASSSEAAVPLEFTQNLRELADLCRRFIAGLRKTTLAELEAQSALAYTEQPQGSVPGHMLGFHLATHVAAHGAQIRTLRNLYRKGRGEPARFFPDNPTFPAW